MLNGWLRAFINCNKSWFMLVITRFGFTYLPDHLPVSVFQVTIFVQKHAYLHFIAFVALSHSDWRLLPLWPVSRIFRYRYKQVVWPWQPPVPCPWLVCLQMQLRTSTFPVSSLSPSKNGCPKQSLSQILSSLQNRQWPSWRRTYPRPTRAGQ